MMSVLNQLSERPLLAKRRFTSIQNPSYHWPRPLLRGLPPSHSPPRSQIADRRSLPRSTPPRHRRPTQSLSHVLDLLRDARWPRTRPRLARFPRTPSPPQRHLPPPHQLRRPPTHPHTFPPRR